MISSDKQFTWVKYSVAAASRVLLLVGIINQRV